MRLFIVLTLIVAATPAQSLWSARRPSPSLISDTTARNTGDVLTVVISETQTIKNQEKTEFRKDASLDASLDTWTIFEDLFDTLPAVSGSSNRDMISDAKYDKQGVLQTRISVLVIDVMPNGNMLVEGRRRIVMDQETKTIRFTGIVRPYDVTSLNTVLSENVANASIAYEGQGPLTATTSRGWLSELLDFVWPF
ncbi:MAG: flagellar basal body L-ring protein FlgH [Planctomycetes bacterium]|nr:flagellar basal body L-ring protein FlgH [Planctomycetota bacterium]